jgi:hypothetical protein
MCSRAYGQSGSPSRRGFLPSFEGSVALGATTPLTAEAVVGDLYVNHRVGLAFRKPAGWMFPPIELTPRRSSILFATPSYWRESRDLTRFSWYFDTLGTPK